MKAKRKLIPAIVLLLVSVLMLSTASYAWFANTTTATVSGMSISAQAPSELKIRRLEQPEFTSGSLGIADLDTTVNSRKLAPAHIKTISSGSVTWETAIADAANASTKKDGSIFDITFNNEDIVKYAKIKDTNISTDGIVYGVGTQDPAGNSVKTPYFLKLTYNVYAEIDAQNAEQNLNLTSVVLTDTTTNETNKFADLYKSVRVLVVASTGDDGDPKTTTYASHKLIGLIEEEEGTPTANDTRFTYTDSTQTASYETSVKLIDEVARNEAGTASLKYDTVEVYVFFDGEVTENKTDNVLASLDALAIQVTFGIEPKTAA